VPWESLAASSLVRIHHRAEPYAHKWAINTEGTPEAPVVVRGLPGPGGERPVISGDGAVTRQELDYWNENRSVIKIGGSSSPSEDIVPAYVTVEGLEVRSARPAFHFTDDHGSAGQYSENAASIHIEEGRHITIRDCVITDSGNGLFSGHGSEDVVIEGNHIHGNGIEGSYYEHNSYTESLGIRFQYNLYGPLRDGCGGNNLKDRSAGTVIRYNWLEAGNRQLDLVESDYDDFVNDPSYRTTLVYGNVIVEPDGAGNSQIAHYGGDGGDESMYRKGVLHFYHNTVVSTRSGNTTLLRLSSNDESADVRNNLVFTTASGDHLAISNSDGHIELRCNWLPQSWTDSHEALGGSVTDVAGNRVGTDPGLGDAGAQEFGLTAASDCRDAAGALAADVPSVDREYRKHQGHAVRPDDSAPDIGAYEHAE
jgi:hypothetical protein